MPTLPSPANLIAVGTTSTIAAATASSTNDVTSVVCAFPVSGQYGPGSRFLYYVLVAACVFGRGSQWLRGACLAAALLIPAVAALHAIVLAAVHVDGAVDMDIYGAFQICAIGVLAGPVTVKLSKTYFNTPGRNLIFLWTIILLAGLLSLVVEFFRATPTTCPNDVWNAPDGGNGLNDTSCGVVCNENDGPKSVLRTDAQNNIYLISTPTKLSFGAGTLLCAAACLPAILGLVATWNKMRKNKWKVLYLRRPKPQADQDNAVAGANQPKWQTSINANFRFYLSMIEIPLFGACIIAIVIVGEINFWSPDMFFQTEPMASVGQWGNLVGTFLAAAGALYAVWVSGNWDEESPAVQATGQHQCCEHCRGQYGSDSGTISPQPEMQENGRLESLDIYPGNPGLTHQETVQSMASRSPRSPRHTRATSTGTSHDVGAMDNLARVTTSGVTRGTQERRDSKSNNTSRHKVAKVFEFLGDKLGTPAPDAFDDTKFQRSLASDYPELPGERERNANLPRIMEGYNPRRDSAGNASLRRVNSRTGSFVSDSMAGDDHSEPPSPVDPPDSPDEEQLRPTQRRQTLNVPSTPHRASSRPRSFTLSATPTRPVLVAPASPVSPTIEISGPQEADHIEQSAAPQTPTIIIPQFGIPPLDETSKEK